MAALLRMICKDARWLPDTSAEPAVAPVAASTAHGTARNSHQPACSESHSQITQYWPGQLRTHQLTADPDQALLTCRHRKKQLRAQHWWLMRAHLNLYVSNAFVHEYTA